MNVNNKWDYAPFSDLFKWCDKSNIGSRHGLSRGTYKLYIASQKEIKFYNEYLVSGETLILGTGGNPCIHYANDNVAYTNHCEAAKSKSDNICTKFYYYYFQKEHFAQLRSTFVGGGIKNSSKKKIGALLVPVIPYEEQQRIVAKIEELFSKLDKGVEELNKIKEQLKIYRQAVLKGAFDGELEHKAFGDISYSRLGKMLDRNKNTGEYRPYLRNINVRWMTFDLCDILDIRVEQSELGKYTATKGDLLMCEGGEPGRCAIWNMDYDICYQKALHRIRFDNNINPKFYMYYFYYIAQTGELSKHFTGTGIKHLTGESLKKIFVPLTDIDNQNAIVRIIEQKLSVCDKIEQTVNESLQKAENLRQSILKQAFEGKLV